ncbi:hypothetical protein F4810DRAFT_713877 [Camillea tinctor]|nr:hypothetical protein F4810DRAFT_713877 [Camillea tinctor]
MSSIAPPSSEETVPVGIISAGKTAEAGETAENGETGKTGETGSSAVATTQEADGAAKKPTEKKVAILWDLDNKTPIALPEDIAVLIRTLAAKRGKIVEYSAIANVNAFIGLPPAAKEIKESRKELLKAERQGLYKPKEPLRCPICNQKAETHLKLEKHYNMLHKRELHKKIVRLNMLKGKRRERYLKSNKKSLEKRHRAHEMIVVPERRHKVFKSLKRAGVLVKIVKQKPQMADKALQQRFAYIKKDSELTLIVISDDSDFCKMVERAKRNYGIRVIIISEHATKRLARTGDEWWSWEALNARAQEESVLPPHIALFKAVEEDDGSPAFVIEDGALKALETKGSKGKSKGKPKGKGEKKTKNKSESDASATIPE